MPRPARWISAATVLAALLVTALVAAGCGSSSSNSSSSKESATPLKIGIAEKGKKASFSLPKSVEGGLVELTVTNEGKAPHGVQLVRYTEGHSAEEVLKEISGESEKTPDWIRGEGGIGMVEPGKTETATLNLEAGKFLITDAATFGEEPGTAELTVTEGSEGTLPSTEGSVTAEEKGKDKYAWNISGLKPGHNQITFKSEGKKAIHLIIAVPIKGKAPPLDQIKKELAKEGPPPSWVEFEKAQSTAVLDGGKSQTTPLDLKSGEYLFFCPLHDRDGGKPHFEEGLLAVKKVQ